ncbi:hypothetical protein ABZW30_40945 [Kitasatospora sp. NPDC004669]|uniref:hypothetical protein n=1 Tax=Kitasatospora sp. NPDC004669 TaxID=3154555 RepID=UPI0033B793B7
MTLPDPRVPGRPTQGDGEDPRPTYRSGGRPVHMGGWCAPAPAEPEAIGRGHDAWSLEEGPADGPALQAMPAWGAGNHDRQGDPDAPDADLLLTVNWDSTDGWSRRVGPYLSSNPVSDHHRI